MLKHQKSHAPAKFKFKYKEQKKQIKKFRQRKPLDKHTLRLQEKRPALSKIPDVPHQVF